MKRTGSVGLLLAAFVALPAPAGAAACSGTSGVTVVVQFPDGHTEIGCAPGDPSSGYDALANAGFPIRLAQGNGGGALCRISNEPSNNNCGSMPPGNAYWAYFHAQPGGSWVYSDTGGGGYDPAPGSVEGWSFGSGSAPTTRPPGSASTPKPTKAPRPTRKPTTTPTRAATSVVTQSPRATTSSSPTQGPTSRPTAPDPTTAPTTVTGAPITDRRAAIDVVRKTVPPSSGGLSWIWGVVLLGALAVAGGVLAVVRRRG